MNINPGNSGTYLGTGNTINVSGASTVNISGTYPVTTNFGGTINNSDSYVYWRGNSTPGSSVLVDSGTGLAFFDFSGTTGLNLDNQISAGSIAGNGFFYLGGNTLTVGSLDTSTTVSGTIADGGVSGGTGGGLVKTGTGTLTLTGANTYTGATSVQAGTLQLGTGGSIADSSSVTVAQNATLIGNGSSTVQALALTGALDITDITAPVTPPATVSYGTFAVQNAYTGGGTVTFNTCLNDGSTQQSDRLQLGGSVSGSTTIIVDSVGGTGCEGADTAASSNGILLVAYSGAAPANDTFTLAAGTASVGSYAYQLAYVAGQGWFLQIPAPAAALTPAQPVPGLGRMELGWLALLLGWVALATRRRLSGAESLAKQ